MAYASQVVERRNYLRPSEFQFNILLSREVRIPKSTIYNIKAIKIAGQSVKVFKNLIRCSLKCEINVH